MSQAIRINKFIAERIGLSRREADAAILAGKVLINGKPATIGVKIDENDKVCYNEKVVPFQAHFSYLMMNKPVGYVCSRKAQGDTPTIYDLLPQKYYHLKTVGRLDKDSSGLILLTDDGDFAFHMTHPKFAKTKRYQVVLDHDLTETDKATIEKGVEIGDGISRLSLQLDNKNNNHNNSNSFNKQNHAKKSSTRTHWLVTMSEGRNRQIRRTFGALGYTVVKLHRIEFGNYKLKNLQTGQFKQK